MARIFCICVFCLAVFQFSENTADPDLWGHVLFGKQFLQTGQLPKTDSYSWTAPGHEWINHEVGAEIILGAAQRLLGGTGLLLLKIFIGLLTFGIALRTATKQMAPAMRLIAWVFGALAVVEISFGFAARPQIFSALALAVELWLLRKIGSGHSHWGFALPPLFALWINIHGGALAGIILLFVAAAGATLQNFTAHIFENSKFEIQKIKSLFLLWFSAVVSAAALLLNPWGVELVRWLVGSAFWFRPEIAEWNSTSFNWNHAAFFICAAIAVAGFIFSKKPRALWEIAVLAALAVMAFRSVRNTPLFCVAALALVPPHLADALEIFRENFHPFEKFRKNPAAQKILAALLVLICAGILFATFTLHKQRAWTMEVPRNQYPVAALQFIRAHDLHGNLLVFFDWGEQCIWELPDSRVSIDGRLDTCYPRDVIAAHWKFYNGEPVDRNALDIQRADFALLPENLPGGFALAKNFDWQPVYLDNLAVVLVKNLKSFPQLAGLKLPAQNDFQATQGRARFPDSRPQKNKSQ